MRITMVLFAAVLAALQLQAQMPGDARVPAVRKGDASYSPLLLFTNGAGIIRPFQDGQLLEIGRSYAMVAVADPGFAFADWMPVNVFTITEYVLDESGTLTAVTNTVVSPVLQLSSDRVLRFTMQPVRVIYDVPGARTITQSAGWQANFVPVRNRHYFRPRPPMLHTDFQGASGK